MNTKKWCLGFVFSSDLRHVLLLRKGKSLHVGLWNGVGGAIEIDDLGSSLNAMVRECEEESGIRIYISRWVEVGKLLGDSRTWTVDIYAARLGSAAVRPGTVWADTASVFENPDCLNDYETDHAVMIPIEMLPALRMAPHGAVLGLAALERLKDISTPIMTFEK